ncbi:hypothetical protein AMECASPLE_010845 [Ameca splendens]|uniref:Uncharacterized protein n=1 Tax=Ameca splendens TaxID=208324 RepID=A0ABV0YBM7_9TELE
MCSSRLFQGLGPATEKVCLPLSFCLVLATDWSSRSADLRERGDTHGCKSSKMQGGEIPFKDLNKRFLKVILKLTGNQCSKRKTGEMCANFCMLVKRHAAAFCTNCRHAVEGLLTPNYSPLQ